VWASPSAASVSSSVVSGDGELLVWSSTEFRDLIVFFVFFRGFSASWVVHLLLFSGDLFCMGLCMWFLPK
jgi:hypothetical protein